MDDSKAIGPLVIEPCQADHGASIVITHKERGVLAKIEPIDADEDTDMHSAIREPWDAAYAHLFAAAPDLLEALRNLSYMAARISPPPYGHKCMWCGHCVQRAKDDARLALAKAEPAVCEDWLQRFTCRGCAREELVCSLDPCPDVIADRLA